MEIDSLTITIIIIAATSVLATFLRGRSKDKCLTEFEGLNVTLENTNGKLINGKLRVETTGLELLYSSPISVKTINTESYILYKDEYAKIQAVIAFHDELTEENKTRRSKELKLTYNPSLYRVIKRKLRNFYNTVKDSVFEIINAVMGQVQKTKSGGAMLASQDKHVSNFQQNIKNVEGSSFEPLLETLIGKRILLEITKNEATTYIDGILKDYSSRFIEIIDVKYQIDSNSDTRNADVVVPRVIATVRGLASVVEESDNT